VSDSTEDLLRSLRRHARAQTAVQISALAELEAHRRLLHAQTGLLKDQVEFLQQQKDNAQDLATWRECVADVEAELASLSSIDALAQLVGSLWQLREVPSGATVDEISRARRLVDAKPLLLEKAERDHPGVISPLREWWGNHDIDGRMSSAHALDARISAAINGADQVPKDGLAAHLISIRKDVEQFDQLLSGIDADLESLGYRDRLLQQAFNPEVERYLMTNAPEFRTELVQNLDAAIAAVSNASTPRRRLETRDRVAITVIALVLVLVLVAFVATFGAG
jgi:hypothetical protein